MQALLGLAIMVCRMVVLRFSQHPDDQERGFVGNTILLTQPCPEEIVQALPPPDSDVSKYVSVCFNTQTMTAQDVGKHHALEIDPDEYIRCSELRKKVCPVFADVHIDKQQVAEQWPVRAVPNAIILGAQAMHIHPPSMHARTRGQHATACRARRRIRALPMDNAAQPCGCAW